MTRTGDVVFVYGTLRSGQANHGRVLAGRPLAPAVLPGHELRLGAWPWVQPADASSVVGEVVEVDGAKLAELDLLEGVASGLYRRERVTVRLAAGGEAAAWTYVAGAVARPRDRLVPGGDWLAGFAWYVGYGSNLATSRFTHYLSGCRDSTPAWRWAPVEVPHRLVFARTSKPWGGGGVAFLDPAPTPGVRTLGRAWLVTWEQFADVLAQECGLPVGSVEAPTLLAAGSVPYPGHWYGCVVHLGRREGWPMITFTDEAAGGLELCPPGPPYRAVVIEGLAEAHGLSEDEAAAYVARHSVTATAGGRCEPGDRGPSPG